MSGWTATRRRVKLPDGGAERVLYKNPAFPGQTRVRKMIVGPDGKKIATYVHVVANRNRRPPPRVTKGGACYYNNETNRCYATAEGEQCEKTNETDGVCVSVKQRTNDDQMQQWYEQFL